MITGSVAALAPTIARALGVPWQAGRPLDGLPIERDGAERVLLLVLDSWGMHVWEPRRRLTPYLESLEPWRVGTLRSVLPSITPVNFSSIGTGLLPQEHGIRSRGDALSKPTILGAAAERGRSSAVIGPADSSSVRLLGPSASVNAIASTKADSNAEVALMTATRLSLQRPALCLVQMLDLDTVGHRVGPSGPEYEGVMAATDRLLAQLVPFAGALGYWTLITADHGMHEDSDPSARERGTHGSDTAEDTEVPLWAVPARQ
jgi:hypothetical protein